MLGVAVVQVEAVFNLYWTKYPVVGDGDEILGSDQERSIEPAATPAVAVRAEGAFGSEEAVAVTGSEGAEVPTLLIADTWKL